MMRIYFYRGSTQSDASSTLFRFNNLFPKLKPTVLSANTLKTVVICDQINSTHIHINMNMSPIKCTAILSQKFQKWMTLFTFLIYYCGHR